MKKFILLFAVISFIFASCSTDNELNPSSSNKIEIDQTSPLLELASEVGDISMFLPTHVLEEGKVDEYFNSLSEEQVKLNLETFKIFSFLKDIDMLEQLHDENPDFENLTFEDLKYYAPKDYEDYTTYELLDSEVKGCSVVDTGCYGTTYYVTKRCCSWIFWCHTSTTFYPDSSLCGGGPPPTDPCEGVFCPPGSECIGGDCVFQ